MTKTCQHLPLRARPEPDTDRSESDVPTSVAPLPIHPDCVVYLVGQPRGRLHHCRAFRTITHVDGSRHVLQYTVSYHNTLRCDPPNMAWRQHNLHNNTLSHRVLPYNALPILPCSNIHQHPVCVIVINFNTLCYTTSPHHTLPTTIQLHTTLHINARCCIIFASPHDTIW